MGGVVGSVEFIYDIVYATTAQGYILLFFVLFFTIFASVAGRFFTNLISHPVISMLRWVV